MTRRRPSPPERRRRILLVASPAGLAIALFVLTATESSVPTADLQARGTSTTASTSPVQPNAHARLLITQRGVTVIAQAQTPEGWSVTTPCGRQAIVKRATPIEQLDVLIDPGHGGSETGAIANGLRESRLNLAVANETRTALVKAGIRASLTRSGDYRLPIATRAAMVNAAKPKLFISIHYNGGPAALRASPGTDIYYQYRSANAKRLGGLIWNALTASMQHRLTDWHGAADAGVKYRLGATGTDDFYGVLRRTKGTPAVLVEPLFLSSASEAALLKTAAFRSEQGAAIASGIELYLTTAQRGHGYQPPSRDGGYNPGGGGTPDGCVDPPL